MVVKRSGFEGTIETGLRVSAPRWSEGKKRKKDIAAWGLVRDCSRIYRWNRRCFFQSVVIYLKPYGVGVAECCHVR